MKKFLSTALILVFTFSSASAVSGQLSDASIDKLLGISGLSNQLGQLPGTVRAGIMQARQRGMNIPDAEFTEMVNIIANSFNPVNLTKAIRVELKKNISDSDAKNLFAWYESDAGKKLTKIEKAASTPEAYNDMIKNAQALLSDEKRVKVAQRVEQAISSVDMAMQIQTNTGTAVYTALLTAADPTKPVDLGPFEAQMAAQGPQIRAQLEQLIILSLVYSYKDVDAPTMNKYIAFLEQANTRKFNTSVMNGMNTAISESTDVMAKDLAIVLNAARKNKK